MAQIATIEFKSSKWSRQFSGFQFFFFFRCHGKNGLIPFQEIENQAIRQLLRKPKIWDVSFC
jgi:hypothetical protein